MTLTYHIDHHCKLQTMNYLFLDWNKKRNPEQQKMNKRQRIKETKKSEKRTREGMDQKSLQLRNQQRHRRRLARFWDAWVGPELRADWCPIPGSEEKLSLMEEQHRKRPTPALEVLLRRRRRSNHTTRDSSSLFEEMLQRERSSMFRGIWQRDRQRSRQE